MKVLIVEDRDALAEEYLRIFGRTLSDLEVEYTHVSSIAEALVPLSEEAWDVILLDSDLGPPAVFPEGATEEDGAKLNNGYDLIRFRRNIEDATEEFSASAILGIAPHHVAATFQKDAGADDALLKLEILKMAHFIRQNGPKEAKVP